jgi:hypothetical protein
MYPTSPVEGVHVSGRLAWSTCRPVGRVRPKALALTRPKSQAPFVVTRAPVLMATSSNFGNMFSAAGASLFLSFLPMLPSQILFHNLLYNAGHPASSTSRAMGRSPRTILQYRRRQPARPTEPGSL